MESHHALIYESLDAPSSAASYKTEMPKSKTEKEEEKKGEKLSTAYREQLTNKRKKKVMRKEGEQKWVDPTLEEWPDNDYRIFCCDLGNEVNDDVLSNAFKKYPSFYKARVVKDKKTLKSKGFGFVSLMNQDDYIRAMREM